MLNKFILVTILFAYTQAITIASQVTSKPKVDYPVRSVYVDKISSWWPPSKIAAGLAVPGYAPPHQYNYVILAFWSCQVGLQDMVLLWGNAATYFSDGSFGATTPEIQRSLKALYNNAGVNIMVSAFGATEFPTNAGYDPTVCAGKLGDFVNNNNLDGVDIDWEDNLAMEAGTGEAWLITFSKELRRLLPNHIISHAPQAPYFCEQFYKNGAYITIDKAVGDLIDFYNVQFYNQGNNGYDTYQTLFVQSGPYFNKTSVSQLIARGIPSKKLVIGKPVTQADAMNSGVIAIPDLANALNSGLQNIGWYAGAMFWQYSSDSNGYAVGNATAGLRSYCKANPNICV